MGQGEGFDTRPAAAAPMVAGGGVQGGAREEAGGTVSYQGTGGGTPGDLHIALGHWTEDDARLLRSRMTNARRAIAGRAEENVDATRAEGVAVGADLLVKAVAGGDRQAMEASGRWAAHAVNAGMARADAQYARAQTLAVESEAETLAASAKNAEVAAAITDPTERARALTVLTEIERNRQRARTHGAAAQMDAMNDSSRDGILDDVGKQEAHALPRYGVPALLASGSPDLAAHVLDHADGSAIASGVGGLSPGQRKGLGRAAELMEDPVRAAGLRQVSFSAEAPRSRDESRARSALTEAGVLACAERVLGIDMAGASRVHAAMTDVTRAEVAGTTGIAMKNEAIPEYGPPEGRGALRPWTPRALRDVEQVLLRLPASHRDVAVALNRARNEAPDGRSGEAGGHKGMALFDRAFGTVPDGMGMTQDDPIAARSRAPSWLEEVVTHEVGHQVGFAQPELFNRFEAAAGWHEGAPAVGAIPDAPRWSYGRTNSTEQFAEMYSSAVNSPSQLHEEFRAAPEAEVLARRKQLQRVQRDPAASADDVARARHSVGAAERQAGMRREQWRLMREDVFGVNDAQVAQRAVALRTLHPGDPAADEVAAEFEREAEKAMTPHQLEALHRRYEARFTRRP